MAYNEARRARMQRKSVAELQAIYQQGTLSSAAAAFELKRRGIQPKGDPEKRPKPRWVGQIIT